MQNYNKTGGKTQVQQVKNDTESLPLVYDQSGIVSEDGGVAFKHHHHHTTEGDMTEGQYTTESDEGKGYDFANVPAYMQTSSGHDRSTIDQQRGVNKKRRRRGT